MVIVRSTASVSPGATVVLSFCDFQNQLVVEIVIPVAKRDHEIVEILQRRPDIRERPAERAAMRQLFVQDQGANRLDGEGDIAGGC